VGSIAELKQLTGKQDITDLHRENIDMLTIPSTTGRGVLRRIPEVFDCWFESGAMPYAQNHYPFENQKEFEEGFPADFIAEGIDQTRGWFYTLLVHSTLLFGKPPFKNLVCHGLVLAADGQKMSKRKKNYPDIMEMVNKYGSDAIRLYLINSPVVRADNLRFKEEGVRDILRDVFLPWYNAYRFLIQNVQRLQQEEGIMIQYSEASTDLPSNFMDRWILSFTQSLVKYVKLEMEAYRLYTVLPRLVKFIDHLTNWYVRMNRKRLKGENGVKDCREALTTLTAILLAVTKLMAPFVPFITEHLYQNLRHLVRLDHLRDEETLSVHYQMLPVVKESLIDVDIERAVQRMQTVIDLGRVIRDRKTLPMKYPLKEVVVIHKDAGVLSDVERLQSYITEELNVKKVIVTPDKSKYGVNLRAEPDHKTLGVRLKGAFKSVMAAIRNLTDNELMEFQRVGEIEVLGEKLGADDLRLIYTFDSSSAEQGAEFEAHSDNNILVLLNVSPDDTMLDEGLAREVINRIQKLRKKAKLLPADEITIYYKTPQSGALSRVIPAFDEFIFATIKHPLQVFAPSVFQQTSSQSTSKPSLGLPANSEIIIQETAKVKDDELELIIIRGHANETSVSKTGSSSAPSHPQKTANGPGPVCKFINVELVGSGQEGRQATLLLENPRGEYPMTFSDLIKQVKVVFEVDGKAVKIYRSRNKTSEITETSFCGEISSLSGAMLYAFIGK